MAADDQLALIVAEGWQVRSIDADHTAVVFVAGENHEHKSGALVPNAAFSQLAGAILHSAIRFAETQTPRVEDGQQITADPIPVMALAATQGRTPTEAILTLHCGNLILTFSVEASTLRDMCMALVPALTPLGPATSH
jgi:hypothetical protein